MLRIPDLLKPSAFSITIFYLVFALLWILLSDQVLIWFTANAELISRYQTIKGMFYVAVTALFLFYLIQKSNKQITAEKKQIDTALYAAGMASWSIDLKTNSIQRSDLHNKLFGIPNISNDWNPDTSLDSVHPEDQELVRKSLEKAIDGSQPSFDVKYRIQSSNNNEERWIRCKGNLVYNEEHVATHLAGVIIDITDKKRLEDEYELEKKRFESIFENIPVMIDITTDDMKTIRVNKAYEEINGYSQQEVRENDIIDKVYPDPETRKRAELAIENADGVWREFENYTKDGDKRIQRWANIRLPDNSTIGIGIDITEQKQLERVHERDRLELEKIYNNIPVLINLHKENGRVYRINKHFKEVTGYTNEDLDELDLISTMIQEKDQQAVLEHMQKANGDWMDVKIITKSGEFINTSWCNIKVADDLSIGIGIDTTSLREKERKLEYLTNQYRNAEQLANFGHWKRDLITNETTISDGFYEIIEVDRKEDEFNFEQLKEIIHPDDLQYFLKAVETATITKKLDIHYRIIKQKSKEIAHIHELGRIETDEDGNPRMISGTIQDITEIVEYQTQLQELAERYRKAEEIAHIGHWHRDIQKDEAIFSHGYFDIVGLKPNIKDTRYSTLLKLVHPDDRSTYHKAYKKALQSGSLDIRFRFIKPDSDSTRYIHELAETEYDENGMPLTISGTIQDITEREKFQQELAQRNRFIESTIDNLPIGVSVNIIDSGEVTIMNKQFSEIYGWPKKELTDVESFFNNVYPDPKYRKRIKEIVMADMASKNPKRMSWERISITTKSGEEKLINAKNIPLYDQNLMISTVVDVTAQVEAEKRLSESEHNYRLLFQKSPQPMWIFDPETLKFIEVNNAALKHYGYSRKEFYGMTLLDIRPEEDKQKFLETVKYNTKHKLSDSTEWRHIVKNGDIIIVEVTASFINYFGNQYRLILVNDITEQKKAEELVLSSLVEGENKERARIARELHDGLGQYLAAANMNLNSVIEEADALSKRKKEQLENGLKLLQYAVTETAQISRNLLPRVVDDYGLALAIESLVENYKSSSTIKLNYYHNIKDIELDREVEFNLYRIAQEGLSNAVKYSEAAQINIQLIKDELDLILSIDDNGVGFDKNSEKFSPGLGFQTIKTRASALGGTFEFDSKPNKGTFISVVIPLNKTKAS